MDLKAAKAKPEARKATWEKMGLKPTGKRAPAKAKPAAAAESSSSSEQAAITQQEEAGWRTASQEEAEKEKERRPKRQKQKEDEKEKEQEKKKLQLPLLPGHLKDKHLNMYTVGCKGDYTTGSILDSYGVPKRKTLLVDCRDLEGPGTMCRAIMVQAPG